MACQGISSKVKLNLLHLALLKAKQGMMSSGTPESLETTYFSFGYETPAHVPSNSIKLILELPWHPFVRILHFYCRRHGFHPGQRTKITHTARPKNKRTKSYYFLMWPIWYLIEMVSILVIASSRSYGHMAFEMSMFLAKFFLQQDFRVKPWHTLRITTLLFLKKLLDCYWAFAETEHLTMYHQVIMFSELPIVNRVLYDSPKY